MATKINTDYYGAENTFVSVTGTGITGNVKTCANNLRQLGYNEIYTGGSLDLSASPWGIGECSLSSCMYGMILNNGNNRISINEHFNAKKNNPFFIYENSSGINSQNLGGGEVTASNLRRVCAKSRLDPQVTFTNSEIQSAISFDNNENIGNTLSGAKPVTYYNYNKSRLLADVVYFIRENSYTIEHDFLVNFLLYPDDFSNVEYVVGVLLEGRFEYGTQGQLPSSGNWVNFSPSIGGVANDIPKFYKSCYYGNNEKWVRPDRQLLNIGYWKVSNYWNLTQLNYGSSPITTNESDMQTPKTNFNIADYTNFFGQISRKNQVFDDVSYHWELKYLWSSSPYTNINDRNELIDGDIMPNSGNITPLCYLVIDDTTYAKPALAYFYAMIHECCFMGLPVIANRYDSTYDIGQSAWIFLPKFDEHLVTTGDFVRSNNASAPDLVNYAWGDVFGVSMPEYDPDYQPPEPIPEDADYGDTSNQGSARGLFPAGVNIYLMSRSDYNIFMSELNGYYQGSSPDDWTLDFQGVNPSDYILSAYYTPYNFLKSENKSAVKIGPLTLTTDAYELSQGSPPDDPNKWKTFTYGTRTVTPAFYDFRDYEPYTTVELYLPLAGTVQLETAYVMNHDITVTYYFDLMSMSGVACVYRDNMLYKTSDFQLGCQVPLLSQNMGTIQNQIMSLDTARKQNNIRLTAATTATVGSAVKALSGKASDVSNLAGGAGLMQIASGVINADKIDYDMTHTPASVSVTGAAEPMNNYSVGQLTPKLIIKRPLMLPDKNDAIYSHTVGNACLINATVGEMSGLIVCSNADLSGIAATSTELSAIQSALTTGIYV